ncbi:MAG: LytTR family DNA-binding domain-containing protein [Coriobacteriaceae bacterium]|nr:LytTR family DNA-binding domain-containing protein [Coriobacteriaceae bacterium]
MLRAMIVDDEAPARSELRFLLEQTGKIGSIIEASSVRSAIETLMEVRVDVVFLDISMPGASGLQLAEALSKLKNPPSIVFVTAYSDHAVEAFEVDAVDYLLKPVEEERLDRAIERVIARSKPAAEEEPPTPPMPVKQPTNIERIPVEKGGRKVLIPVDQIRFIMAKDDYSCIFTDDDRFLSTTSLAQFESKLSEFGFFRVHRRYIVNLAHVEDVESGAAGAIQLGVKGIDERIPVSRRRVVPLKKALNL